MKITVLIENTAADSFIPEHGLSLFVHYGECDYLIDTGSSGLFADNAKALNVDLTAVSDVFLSHAHYDHAGGLIRFFELNDTAPVYLQRTAEGDYYAIRDGVEKYIGIPKTVFSSNRNRLRFIEGGEDIHGIYLVPHSAETFSFSSERGKLSGLYKKTGDEFLPDDFVHEQSVVFKTENGLVIVNSCSHVGADIIAEEVHAAFPCEKLFAYIGGFHLESPGKTAQSCLAESEIIKIAERMSKLGFAKIYTGHCTGNTGFDILKTVLGTRLFRLTTGMEIEL